MAVQDIISSVTRKTRHHGFSCTLAEFDHMCAWADACGFQDELLHVVVEKWALAKAA